ncbi:MAG TPA: aminoglycoside phosphotransferase family protein [Candidatus Ruania gallistercoris]|uniref:Aminoglycoside phosphotransferase family protein n=1 Tax=Candidatus Ruania gallistercoris TaxID=2838746 RepID=A0A9D2ECY1_9MICO|nr:aminoglycoside phosphotransferase family protein [Candidatus Ruania gallistercoris]
MPAADVPIPDGLVRLVTAHVPDPGMPSGADWLDRLPGLVREVLGEWDLNLDGPPAHGYSALVLPVRSPRGPAVVKLVWPHAEGRAEHRALQLWNGRGAVRLLAADPTRWALLLERLDAGRTLEQEALGSALGELTATEELATLLTVLDRPAPPWADTLSDHLHELNADLDAALAPATTAVAYPRRMLEEARALATDLLTDGGLDARLTHTDAHHGNVLWRPDPGEWVAIDAQVRAAEPGWAFQPVLMNAWPALERATSLRQAVRTRLATLAEVTGVDSDRARALTQVRLVRDALWELGAGTVDRDQVTRLVTVAKALAER